MHAHLIGICGTAMASLAGLLKQRGYLVTGSDVAAYPPMSDLLTSLGIAVAQPFSERNLNPRPDFVVVGNAISRGNVELEFALDQRLPLRSLPQLLVRRVPRRPRAPDSGGHAWQNNHVLPIGLAVLCGPACRQFSYRRNPGKLWQLVSPRQRAGIHPRRRRV